MALRSQFWLLPLTALSEQEWEALCDGCGRCCLIKLQDEDTDQVHYTNVACQHLHPQHVQCGVYRERFAFVPDCVHVTLSMAKDSDWLPKTCAYRRRANDLPLLPWHPLLAGGQGAMRQAGISVAGRTVNEDTVAEHALQDHVIRWVAN